MDYLKFKESLIENPISLKKNDLNDSRYGVGNEALFQCKRSFCNVVIFSDPAR